MIDRALMTARLALALGRVNRATYHEDGQRPETDTDHTVMLCLLVADLAQLPSLRGRVDVGQLIAFALVHDVVEAYAGDTVSISLDAEQRRAKARRETAALNRLSKEFGADSWLVRTIKAYEAMDTIEARLVNFADKIAPKLTHALNGGCTMRRLGIGVEPVSEQGQRLAARSPDLPELAELFDAARARMLRAYSSATAPTVEQLAAARAEEVEEARAETLAWRGMEGGGGAAEGAVEGVTIRRVKRRTLAYLRPMSEAEVLTPVELARRLGGRREDAMAWARSMGLVSILPWGERVVWGRVLAVLGAIQPAEEAKRPGPRTAVLPRAFGRGA